MPTGRPPSAAPSSCDVLDSLHVVRPATTLTIGLLMALILIAGVISLLRI